MTPQDFSLVEARSLVLPSFRENSRQLMLPPVQASYSVPLLNLIPVLLYTVVV